MAARSQRALVRLFPKGWPDAARQLALFAFAYLLYRLVRGEVYGRASAAFDNARELISIERALGLFIEPSLQSLAGGSRVVIDAASWMYVNSHFTITFAALVWLYRFRNDSFYFVRNMFMIAMGLALVLYVVYPVAPPRFFPEWGFEDSVAGFTGIDADSVVVNALYNPYAAIPSMHVAFALMLGLPIARLVRSPILAVGWRVYPVLVTFVVISTGNHFLADAVLGAAVAGVSALGAERLGRARDVWGWTPAGAAA